MDKQLPARPNLDHLRRQAKKLLAALHKGDRRAVETFRAHLPAAKVLSDAEALKAGFRLADAQSAVARANGFANWPGLARHVEQLRGMEGTWIFKHLVVDGSALPESALVTSRLLIDGDRFRTETPDGVYEGVFNIDVEAEPQRIDIEFVEGPEAGNTNHGIFRLQGDALEICLDVNGKEHPKEFVSKAGTGHAYETLARASKEQPENVTGGKRAPVSAFAEAPTADPEAFSYAASETLTKLQGDWEAVQLIRDGQELPAMALKTGVRKATRNEIKIIFGGRVMIHALVRIDESGTPMRVDYCNLEGIAKGTTQLGIFKWDGENACFCMGAPGGARPDDFAAPVGSGRTLSVWQPKE